MLRPKWIAFHVLMAALIVAMINLGMWQLRRLDEKQDRNAAIRERSELAAEPVAAWLAVDSSDETVDATEWRRLTATGRYDDAQTVLIRNRSLEGAPGYHVVTPLVTEDGTGVLINRGFLPRGTNAEAPAPPSAPAGDVTVVGHVRPSQERGLLGPFDPDEGTLTEMQRIDVPRLAHQLAYPVVPAYLELESTTPEPASTQPVPLPLPSLDEGPHLSYAIQWFIFSAMAAGGWVLAVRRSSATARRDEARRDTAVTSEASAPTRPSDGTAPPHQVNGAPDRASGTPPRR
jgi:cytochrome oxidase assembly protein ShyY1